MRVSSAIPYEWVVGKYFGEAAKKVGAQASSGVGYYRMGESEQGSIIVAFTRPTVTPRPDHLVPIADPKKIAELEKRRKPNNQPDRRSNSDTRRVMEIMTRGNDDPR